MSRRDETMGPVPNPSQYYLEWNSNNQSFEYWDKESSEKKAYSQTLRFAALKFMNTITGFDENKRDGIFANEVGDTRSERFRVLYRDGSLLSQGFYKDIKDKVNHFGGRFTRSIYAVTPKGVLINIKLRGGQMVNFGVIEKYGTRWQDEWIEVRDFEMKQREDGSAYSVPVFNFGGSLNPNEESIADRAHGIIDHYFKSKSPVHFGNEQPGQSGPPETPFQLIEDDDLPF